MHRVKMLIVMTTMILVATVTSRARTTSEPQLVNNAGGVESGLDSLPLTTGSNNLRILSVVQEFRLARVVVASTVEDGNDGKEDGDRDHHRHPHSRSVHCPDKDDHHHNISYLADDDHKGDNDRDRDKDKDKDQDHHDHCGKGDDDGNP